MYKHKGYNYKVDLNRVQELLKEGKKLREIAEEFGVTRQRIAQISKKLGIFPIKVRQKQKEVLYKKKWGKRDISPLYKEQRHKFFLKKTNAKRIGHIWEIDFGDVNWPTHCPILGLELDYFAEFRQENSVSFDRIDNSKGYVKGNVEVVSWRANRIKNDGTWQEHEKIVDYLKKRELSTVASQTYS